MTAYGYCAEVFDAVYGGDKQDVGTLMDRLTGVYAYSYWGAILLNFVPLQLLWFRRVRHIPLLLFLIALSATIGMWYERYMLLVTSLYRDYLVSSWGEYHPSVWEWSLFVGMLGVFFAPFLLFVRFLPVISAFEVKEALHETGDLSHA
jgi:molybdopterin-containing oxidoreductase family membrane subunit